MENLPIEFVLAQSMQRRGVIKCRIRFEVRTAPMAQKVNPAYVAVPNRAHVFCLGSIEELWGMIDKVRDLANELRCPDAGNLPRGRGAKKWIL